MRKQIIAKIKSEVESALNITNCYDYVPLFDELPPKSPVVYLELSNVNNAGGLPNASYRSLPVSIWIANFAMISSMKKQAQDAMWDMLDTLDEKLRNKSVTVTIAEGVTKEVRMVYNGENFTRNLYDDGLIVVGASINFDVRFTA
jgi:hypothetical protein